MIAVFIFIFGLIIGSFLNALIYRLHIGESIAHGRSKCPHCGHVLAWTDLVPVISFLLLKGTCRYCQKKISWQYPVVELAVAVLFLISYLINVGQFPVLNLLCPIDLKFWLLMARDFIAISALTAIFVYDYKWMIIPDSIVLPAIVAILILNYFIGIPVASILIGALIGFGFFAIQYFISQGAWIGGGDLRLGALMGALLGWPLIVVALFFSYIFGAIISVMLLIGKKVNRKSAVPFGVFLAPAAIIALFWGEIILTWYLGINHL